MARSCACPGAIQRVPVTEASTWSGVSGAKPRGLVLRDKSDSGYCSAWPSYPAGYRPGGVGRGGLEALEVWPVAAESPSVSSAAEWSGGGGGGWGAAGGRRGEDDEKLTQELLDRVPARCMEMSHVPRALPRRPTTSRHHHLVTEGRFTVVCLVRHRKEVTQAVLDSLKCLSFEESVHRNGFALFISARSKFPSNCHHISNELIFRDVRV